MQMQGKIAQTTAKINAFFGSLITPFGGVPMKSKEGCRCGQKGCLYSPALIYCIFQNGETSKLLLFEAECVDCFVGYQAKDQSEDSVLFMLSYESTETNGIPSKHVAMYWMK